MKPYTIFKSAILDVEEYLRDEVSPDKIENAISIILSKWDKTICRPIPGLFSTYEIRSLLTNDDDIIKLMEEITTELDILVVNQKEINAKLN